MDYISYLMGAEEISDQELTDIGVTIVSKSESGSRKITIPSASIDKYADLIRAKMSPGFWNEYMNDTNIVFIFKHKEGRLEEYHLSPENEVQVDKLAAQFANQELGKDHNVYKWLSENDYYHDLMMQNYSDLVNRN